MEHEIDASEHLGEYIESVENKFRPTAPKVVPPWARKQPWRVWTPMLTEYYNIIDNPRRVPSILQPLISKERAFTFGQGKPSYLNFKIYPPDEHGVHRRLYINLCQENLIVGALGTHFRLKNVQSTLMNSFIKTLIIIMKYEYKGAVLVGLGTKHFHLSQNRFHSFLAKRLLLGNPVATATKLAFTGSIGTLSVATKLLARASIGAVMYDTLTRSQEEVGFKN